MKTTPILRWREVIIAILLPLGIAGGARYLWQRAQRQNAIAAAQREQQRIAEAAGVAQAAAAQAASAALRSDIDAALKLRARGYFYDAGPILSRALETGERTLGFDHRDTLAVAKELAEFHRYFGDFAAAEALLRRILETRECILGPDDADTLSSLNDLAVLLRRKGGYAVLEPLFRRLFETRERILGPEHRDTLISMADFAVALKFRSNYSAAEPLLRRLSEIRGRTLGAEHPDTLASLYELAVVLGAKHDYAAAEPLFRRVLEMRERVLGPDRQDTIDTVWDLASLLRRRDEFVAVFRRAAETSLRVFGPAHDDIPHALGDFAGFLSVRGEPFYLRILEVRESTLGPDHPGTILIRGNLASELRDHGDYDGAVVLLRKNMEISARVRGFEDIQTCVVASMLASVLNKAGKIPEAKELAWRAYRGLAKAKGLDPKWDNDTRKLLLEMGETVPEKPDGK